ncbi:MAG: hypothetical protein IKO27_00800, partial [Ruminococcus sp.]|nr:hypothetical protein [Ruminococcus sp.]
VKFVDYDGITVLKSMEVEEGSDAVPPETDELSYTDPETGWTMIFDKWDSTYTNITAAKTVTATYKEMTRYTVKFVDYDGITVLKSMEVEEGSDAVPPETDELSYTDPETGWTMIFDKWDSAYTNITADTTVKATYKEMTRYTVTFYDYNGTTKLKSMEVEEGSDAVPPETDGMSYNDDDEGLMLFSKWDKDYTSVAEDLDVTAVYTPGRTLTLVDWSDFENKKYVSDATSYAAGTMVDLPDYASEISGYNAGWFQARSGLTSDTLYNAVEVSENYDDNEYWFVPVHQLRVYQTQEGNAEPTTADLELYYYDYCWNMFVYDEDSGKYVCREFNANFIPPGLDVKIGDWTFFDSGGNSYSYVSVMYKGMTDIVYATCEVVASSPGGY